LKRTRILGGLCLDGLKEIPDEYKEIISIGERVFIKTGTILGGNGFGFTRDDNGILHHKPHNFGVIISDDVWIGSNCTIDRGRWRDTIIHSGSKFDSNVHVGHNVIIGRNCLIGPHVTFGGSVTVGDGSEIWGNAMINQGVKIGNGCTVGANTYLRHNIPDDTIVYGTGKDQVWKSLKKERGGGLKI
jgi:UDP-3-O-[3-hydroxymyristoyl] glucosamine N-acyltransferase